MINLANSNIIQDQQKYYLKLKGHQPSDLQGSLSDRRAEISWLVSPTQQQTNKQTNKRTKEKDNNNNNNNNNQASKGQLKVNNRASDGKCFQIIGTFRFSNEFDSFSQYQCFLDYLVVLDAGFREYDRIIENDRIIRMRRFERRGTILWPFFCQVETFPSNIFTF